MTKKLVRVKRGNVGTQSLNSKNSRRHGFLVNYHRQHRTNRGALVCGLVANDSKQKAK